MENEKQQELPVSEQVVQNENKAAAPKEQTQAPLSFEDKAAIYATSVLGYLPQPYDENDPEKDAKELAAGHWEAIKLAYMAGYDHAEMAVDTEYKEAYSAIAAWGTDPKNGVGQGESIIATLISRADEVFDRRAAQIAAENKVVELTEELKEVQIKYRVAKW